MNKKTILLAICLTIGTMASAVTPHRAKIPNIPGYTTLKGDFHIHTIFSDDTTWPTTRVDEAVYDGLDFISITDHLDTRHQKMVNNGTFNSEKVNRNTSYEIAAAQGKKRDVMVIHGAEITRGKWMFPAHFNAHFITDADEVCAKTESAPKGKNDIQEEENAIVAGLKSARAQGGFLVWNHPDWERQAHNETLWWPIHSYIYDNALMDGIEIVNRFTGYDPEAFHWAMEKNLAIVSGTDCHKPMFELVDYERGEYRPMTLVFAKERSLKGIREALDARRTAVFCDGHIYGKAELIEALFRECFEISDIKYTEKKVSFKIKNNSSIPLVLTKAPGSEKVVYPRLVYINEGEEIDFSINGENNSAPIGLPEFDVNFYVQNFECDVDTPIKVTYHFAFPKGK